MRAPLELARSRKVVGARRQALEAYRSADARAGSASAIAKQVGHELERLQSEGGFEADELEIETAAR